MAQHCVFGHVSRCSAIVGYRYLNPRSFNWRDKWLNAGRVNCSFEYLALCGGECSSRKWLQLNAVDMKRESKKSPWYPFASTAVFVFLLSVGYRRLQNPDAPPQECCDWLDLRLKYLLD
jgi:hypothetical protein